MLKLYFGSQHIVVSDDHSVINTRDWQRLTRRSVRYSQKICRAGAKVMSGLWVSL